MVDLLQKHFEKFRQLDDKHTRITTCLTDAIFKYTGAQLGPQDLNWRGRTVYVKTKPLLKNEIFIKQKLILQELKDKLGRAAPDSLR